MRLSAVILAGGHSRRMGRDKTALPLPGGVTLLERQLRLAATRRPIEMLVSCRPEQRLALPGLVRRIHDSGTQGPLAGIAAALAAARGDALLVLGLDLVRMTPHLLARIAGFAAHDGRVGAIPRLAGRAEPLASVLPRALATQAAAQLQGDDLSLRSLARHAVDAGFARWFDIADCDSHAFVNWNLRADRAPPARSGER